MPEPTISTRRVCLVGGLLTCLASSPFCPSAQGAPQSHRTIAQPARPLDEKTGFRILVWQYKNDALRDTELYRQANLAGFHIDYGEGQSARAAWAKRNDWPYYVDHAAGKGILHLTPRSGLNSISKDGRPSPRPWSFFDPGTLKELSDRLSRNVPPIADGPVMAIALDDEVSLGTFNSPREVDFSDLALRRFREWLPTQYDNAALLRSSWQIGQGEVATPKTYEQVRSNISTKPPSAWRLAPWMDFRTFMDESQASLFARLVRRTNKLASGVPAGVVGAQQPSAYGGFDYAQLRHALQWTEAYDIGGTNEILHSFWSEAPRRARMQTYFLSGNLRADKWFLWYYLAHGNRSVIAWPSVGGQPWFNPGKVHPHVQRLASTFADVQNDALSVLTHPDTEPIFSPIAILYSHPSVQVGWAIDASVHGKTWPRRSSSLDNSCLSSGKNRVAWMRLLEDLGHQARIIDTSELRSGMLQRRGFKVLVLPQIFALSKADCDAITGFVEQGGSVIADYGTAITDTHGNGYDQSPLDLLFAINRTRDEGWFDARGRFEINGEKYQSPFTQRFARVGVLQDRGLTVANRSLRTTRLSNQIGEGQTLFLNASPTLYFDGSSRAGPPGRKWREIVGDWLTGRDVEPPVRLVQTSGADHGVELIRYRTRDRREIWAIVTNPTRQARVDGAGSELSIAQKPVAIRVRSSRRILKMRDLRTGQLIGEEFLLPRDEAVILEVDFRGG